MVTLLANVEENLDVQKAREVQKCKIIHKVSNAEAVKKIEIEKKCASLNVPLYTPEQAWETNVSNPISREKHMSYPKERVQQVHRPRPNSHQSECCEFKK